MKKILLILSLFVVSFAFVSCDDDDDKKIALTDLPVNAQTFIQTHFPNNEVRLVTKDNDSYDVYLINGFEIDFDLSGEWDSIDGRGQLVPQSIMELIPANIAVYIKEHFAQGNITEVSKELYGYEIGLNYGLDIKFDFNGNFLMVEN
ncbi:PepSY-like domain-containing protein [Dysgonomonas sp. Marseille-P4677]|uniref:PepSY-like domain-containing protein n=1 Tax=Dysgonomonas sp. Marseille-P4677 TaxID=2364790 RepID=UPI00191333E5|nr:PepSY-like domain-containing protein [Dysgonomonas sp. Marseille-P4677]MBK5721625.1 PepSY-like domain-containing protein [Dysgonomonas sp. Marseille-P4677]